MDQTPEPTSAPDAQSVDVPGRFIPLRRGELLASLLERAPLSNDELKQFQELCRLLQATLHFEFHQHLEHLKDLYSPLDPDDEWRIHGVTPETLDASDEEVDAFFTALLPLLDAANYRRVPKDHLEAALMEASRWGLNLDVNLDHFKRLEVYYRGRRFDRREVRDLQSMFLKEEVETEVFERLLVAFRGGPRISDGHREHDPGAVYLKFFKLVPIMDIDMLLPGAAIRMTKLDKSKIILPTLSGIGLTIFKLMKLTIVWTMYGMFAMVALIVGAIGYGVKSFLGYLQTKEKYQFLLTNSLYYKNLDNNAGVLFRLLDLAEEQEFREAVLGYYLLWREAPEQGWTEEEIDQHVEQHLFEASGIFVNFEVCDALAKMVRFGLVTQTHHHYRAVAPETAIAKLDHAWDNFFSGC